MYRYTTLNPIAQVGLNHFDAKYEKVEQLEDAQAVLVRSAAMHEMEFPKNLYAIARAGAGVNNIPLERCAEEGIVVFNTPGANANGVKELVLAGILLASRGIVDGINWVCGQKDEPDVAKLAEKQKKNYAGNEISGKKLGIIGLGAIGVRVANAAVNLGMEVYGYDPFISVDAAWSLSRAVNHSATLEDIYRECDYITIHVPLLDSTKKMINKEAIGQMKDGVILLNFSRDLLVDEEALVEALDAGKVRKYVSDFPNPTTAGHEGCIVIPHLGASTEESEDNCAVMAVKELKDFLENGNIKNSVNYPAVSLGICETEGRIGILHRNIKGRIGELSAMLAEAGINIAEFTNKSKGNFAYSLIDVDAPITDDVYEKLCTLEGVIKVRVIK
jgi:D-3-phosphoglycerate dehydrogenase